MIDVELSNIWGSVSLPDLLSGEKDLFDAHMQLRTNQPDGPDFLGWLNAPEGVMARAVLSIGKAAEQIAELGDTLVIVGSGVAVADLRARRRAGGHLRARGRLRAGADLRGDESVHQRLRAAVHPAGGDRFLPAPDSAGRRQHRMRRRLARCALAA